MASRVTDIIVIAACVGMVVLICYGMFGKITGGGMDPSIAFPWHPVLMTTAFISFMVMGRWSYCADPSWGLEGKPERRRMHAVLMGLAVFAAIGGYVCIFLAHWPQKQFFGYNFKDGAWEANKTRIAHSLTGYVVMTLALAQGLMGPIKMMRLSMGEKVLTFHGTLGKVIIVIGGVNVILATKFWGWTLSFKIFTYLLTSAVTVVGVMYPTYVDQKIDEETPIRSE
mmetsp:Transcript_111818/g.193872  ORF Transcript_111818/g.193872 Transcript_111818/m.193872 type:complete len:226 (+) Transcript_111818:93-770(+)